MPRHFGLLIARLESKIEEKKDKIAKALSSEYGTYKTDKAGFWPWLSGESM